MINQENYCSYLGIFPPQWNTNISFSIDTSFGDPGYSFSYDSWKSQLPDEQPSQFYPSPGMNQEILENVRLSSCPKSQYPSVILPLRHPPLPPQHTTLYSLQKRQNRMQNPILQAKLNEQQYFDAYLNMYGHYPGNWVHSYYEGIPTQNFVGHYPFKTPSHDEYQKYVRDNARRKQIENSIVFQKRKREREKVNSIHRKKLKRLQRDPTKRFRYNLWHNIKEERDELKRGRKIMRTRRRANMSSPEECNLWNCPKKLLRKGRLRRRFPKSPESISSGDRRPRSRSRTPILCLRETPIIR